MPIERIPLTPEQEAAIAAFDAAMTNLQGVADDMILKFTTRSVPEPPVPETVFEHGPNRLALATAPVGPDWYNIPRPFRIITLPPDAPKNAVSIMRRNLADTRAKGRKMLVVNVCVAWMKGSPRNRPEETYNALHAVATGDMDSLYEGLATACAEFPDITVIIRLGHEHNGRWYAWSSAMFPWDLEHATVSRATLYSRAWVRIVSLMRTIASNIAFDWNIASQGADPDAGSEPAGFLLESYPGDAYVDIIGRDTYGRSKGRDKAFIVNELFEIIEFAKFHKKPMSFPEVGVALTRKATATGVAMTDTKAAVWIDEVFGIINATDLAYMGLWLDPEPPGPYDFRPDLPYYPETHAAIMGWLKEEA